MEAEPALANALETPPLAWEEDPAGFFEALRLRENTEYFLEIELPESFVSASEKLNASHGGGEPWPFVNQRVNDVVRLLPTQAWQEIPAGLGHKTRVFATVNFGSFVGVVDLSLRGGATFRVEVASQKIEYFDDFKSLLTEVADETVDLLLQVGSISNLRFATTGARDVRPAVLLFHLRRLMDRERLPAAVEAIITAPHSQLVVERDVRRTALVRDIDIERLAVRGPALPFVEGGPLQRLFRGKTPEMLPERRRRDTVDTPENRYVKDFLEEMAVLLRALLLRLTRARRDAAAREVDRWLGDLDDWLAAPLWREVGLPRGFPGNSQVLLRRSTYREVLQADLMLRDGIALPWQRAEEIAETLGEIRPIFELYEYWCFFVLRSVLRAVCGPETPVLGETFVERNQALAIDIRRGQQSKLQFRYPSKGGGDLAIELFYNRLFQRPAPTKSFADSSYSTSFRPDYSIRLTDGQASHWFHFDAKYRLDLAEWHRQLAQDTVADGDDSLPKHSLPSEDRALYKKADLYKVHAYRDALLGSVGAYVLFPAPGTETLFVRHRDADYRLTETIPSVGAFPLRPGSAALQQRAAVEMFLRNIFDAFAAGAAYTEEAGVTR